MGKSILISIQPKWCELIASGKKTIEVRKTKPKLATPFKCYIYESGGNQMVGSESFNVCLIGKGRKKVIGEFVCDWIQQYDVHPIEGENGYIIGEDVYSDTCLSVGDLWHYGGSKKLYGWHISDLVIYDEPKELSEFIKPCIYDDDGDVSCFECEKSGYTPDMHIDCFNTVTRPPQSWCYIEEDT